MDSAQQIYITSLTFPLTPASEILGNVIDQSSELNEIVSIVMRLVKYKSPVVQVKIITTLPVMGVQ